MVNFVQTVYASGQVDLSQQYAFGHISSLGEALGYLIPTTFSIATTAVTFYFLIGAVRYLLSAGDKDAVQGARDMITHAIIGFILLILLFLIMQFVPEFFGINFSIIK